MDDELARLDDVLHTDVPEPEIGDANIDGHSHGLAGAHEDLGEAPQLPVRHDDAGHDVLYIYLDDLGAVAGRLVGHVDRDRHGVAGGRGGRRERRGGVRECAVGLAVAELYND